MGKLGICNICQQSEAKYKCPKCFIAYCSLSCFKNKEVHNHDNSEEKNNSLNKNEQFASSDLSMKPFIPTKFDNVLNDPQIKAMLKLKSLQFHLLTIAKILNDPSITDESDPENRREIANMKLCNLRMGGTEENQLIEEFIERFLFLTK